MNQTMSGQKVNKDRLAAHLRLEEGEILHAYKDHLGFWTLGIGRLIDKRKGGGISRAESDFLLANDIAKIEAQIVKALPWYKNLTDNRKIALCSMGFQMGINGLLGFKNTLGMMERGEYGRAADNALKSKWAQQTPERAKRVTDMIRNG